jgi:hypothetical protein
MNSDSYTLSQTLGKYYQQNYNQHNELPDLHDLVYLSKDWYQGDIDRYAHQECDMPITKQEFVRYISKFDKYNISIIKLYIKNGIARLIVYVISQYEDYNNTIQYMASKYPKQEGSMMILSTRLKQNDIIELPDRKESFAFSDSGYDMSFTFDVKTIYNILTQRGTCPDIIKDYAKDFTLNMFDDWINKLSYTQGITLINLYLFGNASALGIERNYYDLGSATNYMDPNRMERYTNDTEYLRTELIGVIRESILNMN